MENNTTSITKNNKIYMVHPLPRATSTELCFLIYYMKTYSSIYTLTLQIHLSLPLVPPCAPNCRVYLFTQLKMLEYSLNTILYNNSQQ